MDFELGVNEKIFKLMKSVQKRLDELDRNFLQGSEEFTYLEDIEERALEIMNNNFVRYFN
jgi:hypothetical protein